MDEVSGTEGKWRELSQYFEDIYFSPDYYKLNRHIQEGEAQCFIFKHKGHTCLYPYFLRKIPGTEFFDIEGAYGYNGVSNATDDPEYLSAFHQAFSLHCQKQNIIAEFTRFHPLLGNEHFCEGFMDIQLRQETVFLDLTKSYDEIWKHQYSPGNRNKITKGGKYNVEIRAAESREEYLQFAGLLREHLGGKLTQSFYLWSDAYFEELLLWENSKRLLLIAESNEGMIAGALFLYYGNYVHYHASARKADTQNIPATNLLLDEAIQIAIRKGAETMHLGGGMTMQARDPLLLFKKNFSKEISRFKTGTRVHNIQAYNHLIEDWIKRNPKNTAAQKSFFLSYRLP